MHKKGSVQGKFERSSIMKKLAALLTLSLILSMSACNTSSNEPSGSSSAGSSEEEIVIKFGYTPGDLTTEESREVA